MWLGKPTCLKVSAKEIGDTKFNHVHDVAYAPENRRSPTSMEPK